ncbi:MAG: hypothetical protein GC189_01215 [Alphaproteobacteria bacterium]|nr:hypothetical protein [Alphaproteobacteria bacterium]
MTDTALLESVTELAGKQADLLFALVNFYGLVVIAVIGWIVNTGKDGPGVSWARVVLFNLGFLAFFAASFAGFWFLYDRMAGTVALWGRLARAADVQESGAIAALTAMPPIDYLWGMWGFNALILVLATVLLRRGGYGRT